MVKYVIVIALSLFSCASRKESKEVKAPISIAIQGDTATKTVSLNELINLMPGESLMFENKTPKNPQSIKKPKSKITGSITKKNDGSLTIIASTPTTIVRDTVKIKAECPVCPAPQKLLSKLDIYFIIALAIIILAILLNTRKG